MPQITDDNEARAVARLIKNGQLTGAGRDAAMSALRAYSNPAAQPAAPVATDPAALAAPTEPEEPSTIGNVVQLAKRSGARLASGIPTLAEGMLEKGREVSTALVGDPYEGLNEEQAKALRVIDPSAAMLDTAKATKEKTQQWEKDAVAALSPDVRRSIELQLVERDEQGALKVGEGARDPWWWTANAIDMGAMMAPGIGTAGITARLSYASKYGEALAFASAQKMPQSLAIAYARKEAEKAATRAAVIAGGLTEGTISGGLNASQVEQTIGELDEQTMMNYAPYREMRERGATHEVARAKVATDRGFAVGIATAAATGLTGAPLNAWIARWATKTNPVTSRVTSALEGAALEGGQEFVQEGTEQVIQNKGEQPITGKGTWEGVLENAITGGVLGGVMGGAGGALAGPNAKTAPKTAEPDPKEALVEQQRAEYQRTQQNLTEIQDAAQDPSIRVAKADIDAAREEHRQATVALSQTLLQSGKLDAKTQKSVAAALQQAEAAGVKPKVEAKPIEGEVRVDEPKPVSKGAAGATAAPAAKQEAGQGAAKAPVKAAPAEVLNEAETARFDALNRVATADTLETGQLNNLVAEGLAKANRTGKPLLTPAGRRQHKALEARAAAAEAAEKAAQATAKSETVAKKPAAKPAVSEKPKQTVTEKPPAQEPAKSPALKPTDLREPDFVALERLDSNKPVGDDEAAGLERAGLVRRRAEGGYAIKPAGRRELRAYRQSDRQLPVERELVPAVEGKTLTAPRAKAKLAADVQKDLAFTKRERQQKREQRRTELKKQRDFTLAKNQLADQQVDVANRSLTTIEPSNQMREAFDAARVQREAVSTKRGQPLKRGRKEQMQSADAFFAEQAPIARRTGKSVKLTKAQRDELLMSEADTLGDDSPEGKRALVKQLRTGVALDGKAIEYLHSQISYQLDRAQDMIDSGEKREGTRQQRIYKALERQLKAVDEDRAASASGDAPLTYEPAVRRQQNGSEKQGFVVKQGGKEAAFVETEEEAKELTRPRDQSEVAFSKEQTKTAPFKRWFGASKVVDEDGEPMRAFHGTAKDFTEFNTNQDRPENSRPQWLGDLGAWFAAPSRHQGNYDPENAEFMAGEFAGAYDRRPADRMPPDRDPGQEYRTGARSMPVYLSIKNPAEFDGWGDLSGSVREAGGSQALKAQLIEGGYDGIVIRNSMTDGNVDRDDWIAFKPTQIKSAIGNRGTFDPGSADITKRAGTGKGVSHEIAHSVAAQLNDELGVNTNIAQTANELPQYVKNIALNNMPLEEFRGMKGLFVRLPSGGTELWLIQENNTDRQDAYLTGIHEAVGHQGMRAMLGRNYNETMRQIRKSFPREVRASASRNGIAWTWANKRSQEVARNLAAEELVAYATERVLKDGANSRQRSTWAKVVTYVREQLRKIGWVSKFSQRDIMDMILRSRDYLKQRSKAQLAESAYNAEFYAARAKGDKNAIRFKHFSNLTEDEVELSPAFMGTGIPGREAARAPVPQISLYPDDIADNQVEEGLRSKTAYVVEVPRDALYDASEDRLNLRMKAQVGVGVTEEDGVKKPMFFRFDANQFDKLVQDAGFDGYYTPAASGILKGQGRLFKSVPARRVTDEALARMDDATTVETQGNSLVVRADGGGEMRAEIRAEQGYLWVRSADVPTEQRGTGRGLAMAQRLAREAYTRGLRLASDNRVSENAVRVYEGLARRGYAVKRNPAEQNAQGELVSSSELKPVFEVTGGELAAAVSPLAGGRLLGQPHKAAIPGHGTVEVGPFEPAREAARKYRAKMGIDTAEPRTYVRVDPRYARSVANAFEKMKHDPTNPKVKAAYSAMIEETIAQYQAIKETGLKVEFIEGKDPYAASPRMAIEDVKNNNHLWVFPTDAGFGTEGVDVKGSPMLEPTSEKIGDRVLLANDVFRIVHDYFGHVAEGNGFRADGEENAWRIHASMYSPLARAAMTTETRGQNSWLNFGPHGAKNRSAKSEETVFAPQKTGLLPKEFWQDPSAESDEGLSEARQTAQETIRKLAKFLTPAERRKLNQSAAKKLVDLFKQLPSEKELAAAALAGQAKRGWYRKSAEAISNIFGPDAPRFAALLAALSPQTSVEMNLKNTVQVWRGWIKAGRPTKRADIMKVMGQNVAGHKGGNSVLGAWKNNAVRALTDPDPENLTLSGPKVDSFAANLRGETNAVTLDTWMANFALVEQTIFSGGMTKGGDPGKRAGYLAYSARVRQAAAYLTEKTGEEWTPAEVQETVWSFAKALYEESDSFGAVASARDIIENEELTDALINATPDFATLFRNPEYEGILRSAGYGAELDRLAGQASDAGAVSKKIAPLEGDRQRLLKAAGRLDKLKEQRRSPDVAFSILGGNTGDPDLDAFLGKIGGPRRTLRQMWQDWTTDLADRTALAVFDHLHGIKRAETLAGIAVGDMGYTSARLASNSAELTQAMVEYGYPVWKDGAADIEGDMGLMGILKPLGDNVNLWLAYMVAKRADRLMVEGRENLFERSEIDAALRMGRQHPEFDVVSQRYAAFQSRVLDFAEEAGIIDPAGRALWENADYIPFYRVIENGQVGQSTSGGALGKVRNQIVKLRGGGANIGDPLENIVRNWMAMMDASLKAQAARLTVDNLNGTGLVTRAPQVEMTQAIVPKSQIKTFIKNNPTLVSTLAAVGLNVNKLPPAAFQGLQKMMAVQPPTDEDIISVWRDGKREYWHVHDDLLFQSLQGINAKAWGPLMEVFRYPKRLLTAMVTTTPQFAVKNLWRDMWHVFVQGTPKGAKVPLIPGIDTVKGTISQIRMDEASRSMLAGGGSFTHGYIRAGQTAGAAATIRRAMRKNTAGGIALNTPAKLWGFYRDMLNASENSHRVAIYNRELAAGKSRKEALFQARDMLDFGMRGNNAVVRFLIESVPFMNARLQGLYRLGRGFKTDYAAVAIRGLLLSVASVALLAANHDDERYKELTNAQKDSYWHFFDVLEKGDHWKLPKPFEVGALFATVPEAIFDAFITNADEPDATKQSMQLVGHAFGQQLNLSPQVQSVWPLFELAINKDTFTEAPILTQGDEGVLPEDQDSPRLSPTYRAIAHAMPDIAPEALRSPKQLEHLGRGYLGNLQDYVLLVSDNLVRKARGEPAPPTRATEDWPGLRDFRTTGPSRHTKYMDTMYGIADEAEAVYRSLNRATKQGTDEGDNRADQLETEKEPLLGVRRDFNKAVEQVNELRRQQREIQLDTDLTPDEKRGELDDIQREINDISRDVYDLRPGGKLNPEIAGELIGKNTKEQVRVLKDNGLPGTAALLEGMA